MALRTYGPRDSGEGRITDMNPAGFYSYLIRVDTIQQWETGWSAGQYGQDRSAFVKVQLARIAALYTQYADALNKLAQTSIGVSVESLLATAAGTAGTFAAPPFGTLLKGLSLLLTTASKAQQAAQLALTQAKVDYLKTELNKLQSMYDAYQAELKQKTLVKFALVGLPLLLKIFKKRNVLPTN